MRGLRLERYWSYREVMRNGFADPITDEAVAEASQLRYRSPHARAMVKDGLYEKVPAPDYLVSSHVFPTPPAGSAAVRAGRAMASRVDIAGVLVEQAGGAAIDGAGRIDAICSIGRGVCERKAGERAEGRRLVAVSVGGDGNLWIASAGAGARRGHHRRVSRRTRSATASCTCVRCLP